MSRVVLYPATNRRTAANKAYEVMRPVVRGVENGGRRLAPRGTGRHGSGKVDNRPSLAQSWYTQWTVTPRFIDAMVGNRAAHAMTVSLGSSPHMIFPKRGPLLAFEWPRGNFLRKRHNLSPRELFYFRRVLHPGNKRPVRFLQTPLALYGRRGNFKVTLYGKGRTRFP
jgi:hypothetical protein